MLYCFPTAHAVGVSDVSRHPTHRVYSHRQFFSRTPADAPRFRQTPTRGRLDRSCSATQSSRVRRAASVSHDACATMTRSRPAAPKLDCKFYRRLAAALGLCRGAYPLPRHRVPPCTRMASVPPDARPVRVRCSLRSSNRCTLREACRSRRVRAHPAGVPVVHVLPPSRVPSSPVRTANGTGLRRPRSRAAPSRIAGSTLRAL